MNAERCDHVRELAAELALDSLPGDERADVLAHLDECAGCRDLVDELSRAADDVLTVLPEAAVPGELEDRIRRDAHAAIRPPSNGRSLRLMAAAIIVLVVAAGVLILGVRSADAPDPGRGIGEFALVASDGAPIGSIEITGEQPPQIVMEVDDGRGDTVYRCVVTLEDGSRDDIGYLEITDGAGAWTGDLGHPPATVTTAELVDDTGQVVATATID